METTLPKKWLERIQPFADGVKKTVDEITKALEPALGTVTEETCDEALSVLSNSGAFPDADLKEVFKDLKIPFALLNSHLAKLRGAPVVVEERAVNANNYDSVLPTVPEDESFIAALKVGGDLKVDKTVVISAIKAAVANRLNLFDLPKILDEKMVAFAETQEEPVGAEWVKLRKLVTSRSYADILSAMGFEGNFMTKSIQASFLSKLDSGLWNALRDFYEQLDGWQKAWTAGASNPGNLVALMLMGQAGGAGVLPPGMMNPPETNGLHDEAESVIKSINKVFAGLGIPAAKALAYDATRIKEVLENPALPNALGVANREQMLKALKVDIGADYVRLERNLARFTLAIMEFPKITTPNQEYAYIAAMIQLGAQIPWQKLETGSVSGIGKARSTSVV